MKTCRHYAFAASLAICLTSAAANADKALIVGVNHYPNLPVAAQLDGSVNDANLMASKLKADNFDVLVLTDAVATKQGILNALQTTTTVIKPEERFVFYFAGHGAKLPDGSGVLLASDASSADKSNYITKDELAGAVAAINAKAKTVVLDSCFSGAMTRGITKGRHPKARFYNFFGLQTKRIVLAAASHQDNPSPISAGNGKVCFFAACTDSQRAYEDEFDGKVHGVFTHYLVNRLKTDPELWSSVQSDVTAGVTVETEQNQSPVLSAEFADVPVFDGKGVPNSAPVPERRKEQSIWQTFNEDHAKQSMLSLDITPDFETPLLSSIAVGQKFHLQVTTGRTTGYLVVIELDTDGALNLISPMSGNVEDAMMSQNGKLIFPSDPSQTFSVNKVGSERVRAILFNSKADAQALLHEFQNGTIDSVSSAKHRSIFMTSADVVPFYTASAGFEVVAELPK
ncbi:MAG: caspase family protein [Capsulimonadaceae bacterium]|nr:caspase family protein [Capsulimonadaceae bacterium]